jgi:hypothetical protein
MIISPHKDSKKRMTSATILGFDGDGFWVLLFGKN